MGQILGSYGLSEEIIAFIAVLQLTASLIFAFIISILVNKYKKYTLILKSLAFLGLLSIILVIYSAFYENLWCLIGGLSGIGIMIVSSIPISVDLSAELTYPCE